MAFSLLHENRVLQRNPNSEVVEHVLCFSPTSDKPYCFLCKLIICQSQFVTDGLNDWKHAPNGIWGYEMSKDYLEAIVSLVSAIVTSVKRGVIIS